MAFVAIRIEWDGRLARHLWNGRDGRVARLTLLPPAYFHRNPSGPGHAISGTGH
jgi:hypothetical protein